MRNFLVTVDGRQYQVSVEEVKGGFPQPQPVQVPVAPVAPVAPVQAAPVQAPQQEAAPQPAPTAPVQAPQDGYKYTAPMPGMIKKLSLSSGSQVKKGDV
ncbi:MAG: acetyl-CoA carboxylase biotin carboxyl carrier protein subunit, partial [Clostridia bacterium]|nr:acetyl-CoA carboxylase biotin carboxyl carrier protein subunit [Clostridia bacterium]